MAIAHTYKHTPEKRRTLAVSAANVQQKVLLLLGTLCFTPLDALLKVLLPASSFGMLCVYDGADGGEVPQVWTHWGRHYEEFERDLSRQEVLPYLREIRKLTGKPPPRSARAPTAQAPVSLT